MVDLVVSQRTAEWIFFLIHFVGGQVGLGLLLATLLFAKLGGTKRCGVVNTFCVSWIFTSVFYSLILYSERASTTADDSSYNLRPSRDLCVIQANILAGCQIMTALSTLSLVINLWLSAPHSKPERWLKIKNELTPLLVLLPYLGFIPAFWILFCMDSYPIATPLNPYPSIPDSQLPNGALDTTFSISDEVQMIVISTPFYCTVDYYNNAGYYVGNKFSTGISFIIIMFNLVCGAINFILEAHVLWTLGVFHKWRVSLSAEYRGTFIRVIVFSVYRFLNILCMLTFWSPWEGYGSPSPANPADMKLTLGSLSILLQACVPLVAFLTLGSRSDILQYWATVCRRIFICGRAKREEIESGSFEDTPHTSYRSDRRLITSRCTVTEPEGKRVSNISTVEDLGDVVVIEKADAPRWL